MNLVHVEASERFLTKLKGVADPEEKRKIIGHEFIRVFEDEARKLDISFGAGHPLSMLSKVAPKLLLPLKATTM